MKKSLFMKKWVIGKMLTKSGFWQNMVNVISIKLLRIEIYNALKGLNPSFMIAFFSIGKGNEPTQETCTQRFSTCLGLNIIFHL